MKVIKADNFDRPWITPVVVVSGLTREKAERTADQLNSSEGEDSLHYYMVVADDWEYDYTL